MSVRLVLGFSGYLVNYKLCSVRRPPTASNNNELYTTVSASKTKKGNCEFWGLKTWYGSKQKTFCNNCIPMSTAWPSIGIGPPYFQSMSPVFRTLVRFQLDQTKLFFNTGPLYVSYEITRRVPVWILPWISLNHIEAMHWMVVGFYVNWRILLVDIPKIIVYYNWLHIPLHQ